MCLPDDLDVFDVFPSGLLDLGAFDDSIGLLLQEVVVGRVHQVALQSHEDPCCRVPLRQLAPPLGAGMAQWAPDLEDRRHGSEEGTRTMQAGEFEHRAMLANTKCDHGSG